LKIGLTDKNELGSLPGFKETFHRSERNRLMVCDVLSLLIAGREENQQRCDGSGNRSGANEQLPEFDVPESENVIRSNGSHDERSGYHSSEHRVDILPDSPWVEEKSRETCKL